MFRALTSLVGGATTNSIVALRSRLVHGARSRLALVLFSKGQANICFQVDTPDEICSVAAAVELKNILHVEYGRPQPLVTTALTSSISFYYLNAEIGITQNTATCC
jgi:hypothetical protein